MQDNLPKTTLAFCLVIVAGLAVYFLVGQREFDMAVPASPAPISQAQPTQSASSTATYSAANTLNHMALTDQNVIWYTNYYRVQNGLPPLATSAKLSASATAKNASMVTYNYFAHTQPGTTVGFDSFIDAQGYSYITIGENLASGNFQTSYDVVNAWMQSAPHKKNILDPLYTDIGVAITPTTKDGEEIVLVTQHFGKPTTSCPTIDQSIKTSIALLDATIEKLKSDTTSTQDDTDAYNTLVNTYNDSISQMTDLVATYNKQVKAFDACIQGGN